MLQGVSAGYPAGRSNILRYLILYREGGIYLDFDTLTVKDYRPLLAHPGIHRRGIRLQTRRRPGGRQIHARHRPLGILFGLSYYLSLWNCRFLGDSSAVNALNRLLMRAWSVDKLNNAVLGCEAGNAFFGRALALVPETDPRIRYALGPILMNRTWNEGGEAREAMRRLPRSHFYFIPPSQTFRFFYGPSPALPGDAYTLHWCSSNHKDLAAGLTLREPGPPRPGPDPVPQASPARSSRRVA